MTFGPLVGVNTTVAAVSLDIQRQLNMPPGVTMALVRPDHTALTKWAIVATITRGWNRASSEERAKGGGYTVHFHVADLTGEFAGWVTGDGKATHALVDGVYYEISDVPPVPQDVAQVFDITCYTRTLVRAVE